MENAFYIDLSVKFDLNHEELAKLSSVMHQLGYHDVTSKGFQGAAMYICEMKLLELPVEELIEEMKRKKMDADNA